MRKINLQLFAEAVHGSKMVYLFRALNDAATKDGVAMAFVTENTITESKDSDSVVTKDGNVRTPGAAEIEISATALLATGDVLYDRLRKAMHDNEIIEIWEANLAEPVDGDANKFKGCYYQGYLNEFEKTSSSEDNVEISTTFGINGVGAEGDVTVTKEQQAVAAYVFTDTTKKGA